ncbi:hypothetical protein LT493_10260 [Streptomyces tricolor]|nr:hypothetical protein [Streptomyces tricolor]
MPHGLRPLGAPDARGPCSPPVGRPTARLRIADDAVYSLLLRAGRGRRRHCSPPAPAGWTRTASPSGPLRRIQPVVGTARRLAEHQQPHCTWRASFPGCELIVLEPGHQRASLRRSADPAAHDPTRSLLCGVSDLGSTAPHLRHAHATRRGRGAGALEDRRPARADRWGTRIRRRGARPSGASGGRSGT